MLANHVDGLLVLEQNEKKRLEVARRTKEESSLAGVLFVGFDVVVAACKWDRKDQGADHITKVVVDEEFIPNRSGRCAFLYFHRDFLKSGKLGTIVHFEDFEPIILEDTGECQLILRLVSQSLEDESIHIEEIGLPEDFLPIVGDE